MRQRLNRFKRYNPIDNLPEVFVKLGKYCPTAKKIFFSKKNEYPVEKGIGGFFFGLVVGMIFYHFILKELDFSPLTTRGLGSIVCLMLAVGCAVSSQLRCTTLLTFPAFCGRAGRGALKALVIAYVIAGPVQNLTTNAKDVIRTFACTTVLTYNLTKTRFILMFKPFQEALLSLKADLSEIKDTLNTVKEVARPITNEFTKKDEIEGEKEANDYLDTVQGDTLRSLEIEKKYKQMTNKTKALNIEAGYFKKLEYRCEGVVTAAGTKCRKIFAKAYDDCYETVSWMAAWLLCWPMKLTFVCSMVQAFGGDDVCDASEDITTGFGKAYVYLSDSKSTLAGEFSKARVNYKISRPYIPLDVRGAADTAQAVIKEFQQKKSFMDSIMTLVKRILTLVFIRIIIKAQDYQEKYLSNIEFDNVYITKYFRKIDARRKQLNKHTLLPLKKMEKPKFIDPHSVKLSRSEKSHVLGNCIKIGLEMVTATTIIIIDRIFYETLDIVRDHAKIEFHQAGYHDLVITVKGTGMIAVIVKSIIKHFNFKKTLEETYTNEFCLPRPSLLSWSIIRKIYGTYLVIFVMIILEGYTQRLGWIICAFYYPKREKKRILYLYNETLKQRIGFYRYMKSKVGRMIKENKLQQDVSVLLMLRLKFPGRLGWLDWFEDARRVCLICGEREPRRATRRAEPYLVYECPGCLYVYCSECWLDIGQLCFVCNPPDSDDEGSDYNQTYTPID